MPEEKHEHHHRNIQNIKIATFLNVGFTFIELIGGALTNSLAILADALHDLGDSIVLISAWKIEKLSLRAPDWQRTFGYRRLSLLAAFLNAVIILGGTLLILFQVIGRLIKPQVVHADGMIVIAFVGIIANALGSLRLRRGGTANEKMLSWHLLEDVLGWIGLLISATVIRFTGLYILDPVVTIFFSAFILWGVWRNSKELFNIFLEGCPSNVSLSTIIQELEDIKGVEHVYDAHLWSLDGKHNYFSTKAVVGDEELKNYESIKSKMGDALSKYNVTHTTIELKGKKFYSEKEQEQKFLK